MDWSRGYSATWRLMQVDTATWAALDELPDVASISVSRSDDELVESGSAELTVAVDESFGERWCTTEMLAEQSGEVTRVAVATLLMAPSADDVSHGRKALTLEGRSVLAPAEDEKLLAGTYVAAGEDGAAYVGRLLSSCTPAPIVVEGSFRLSEPMVFAQGTSKLEAAWMLLNTVGWCIQIDGDGTIHVLPKPTEPSLDLGDANAALVSEPVGGDLSQWSLPNRYTATDGSDIAVAVNMDPDDPISTVGRGRYVDEYDDAPMRRAGETLSEYAERKLAEMTELRGSKTYTREWWPGVTVHSVVHGGVAAVGLEGDMRVTAQDLVCGAGLAVKETVGVIGWR